MIEQETLDKPPNEPSRSRTVFIIPVIVASGLFMENLDSTVINTAIPTIARAFNEIPLHLNIAITSYLLSLAVFIPISGWVADRFGARNVFCAAIMVFTIGSGLCGISQNLIELVITRIVQGLGGAMMTPVGRLILVRSFPRSELVRAMSYVTVPALVGPAIGPVVGGFITTYASWRWIFYINLPIGIIGCFFAWRVIGNFKAPTKSPFDLSGFLMVGTALATLQLGLESFGLQFVGWPLQLGFFATSAAFFALYAYHAHSTRFPAIDLAPLRAKTFTIAVLTGGSIRIPLGSWSFLTPLFLQVGLGYTSFQSGLHTFLTAVGALLMKTVAPLLLRYFGFRRLLLGNSLIAGATLMGMACFDRSSSSLLIALYLLVTGFFRSIQFTGLNTLAYAELSPEMMSRATSFASVCQQLTMSLGVAISSTMLALIAGNGSIDIRDFHLVFLINGILAMLTVFFFFSLTPADGAEVSGHRSPSPKTAL